MASRGCAASRAESLRLSDPRLNSCGYAATRAESLWLSDRSPKPCGYAATRAEGLWLSDPRLNSCGYAAEAKPPNKCNPTIGKPEAFRTDSGKAAKEPHLIVVWSDLLRTLHEISKEIFLRGGSSCFQ